MKENNFGCFFTAKFIFIILKKKMVICAVKCIMNYIYNPKTLQKDLQSCKLLAKSHSMLVTSLLKTLITSIVNLQLNVKGCSTNVNKSV